MLEFEPEIEGQSETLAASTARRPVPRSSLAFEPEAGDVLDRVLTSEGRGEAADRDIASLIELAAGSTRSSSRRDADQSEPRSRDDPGVDLSGDLEAELFGMAASDDFRELIDGPELPGRADPQTNDKPKGTRRTTGFLRATRFFPAQADGALKKLIASLRSKAWAADVFLASFRLNIGGVSAAVAIAALTLSLGLHPQWVAGIAGICLALVALGQPASNLLGYASVIIGSAAVAEIIRQHERFHEIFRSFIG